ncbi:MAG: ribosome biogenesis GTPase Der [Candidatus Zixiibacteriota bacterium]|nr:MAG: ribosome biogenesis GTPase Der [candidate division Zixibacteria bacterium]
MSMPTVAIVGRPNVGKSSLFNRFLRRPLAVVHERPGITRDRNYAVCDWNGVNFRMVDTGGIIPNAEEEMDRSIFDQTEFALNEADLILFLVDAKTGIDSADRAIANRLTRAKRNCVLVANKSDSDREEVEIYEFMALGLGEAMPVSATVGRGVGDLLDVVVARLPAEEEKGSAKETAIRVAVVGRPNVGKSSFINKLTGQERLIVTPIAGTTRDAVDTSFEYDGQKYILIDTAGLRRRYKVQENVEFYTALRTSRAIDNCDVAIVLIDAVDKVTSQDQRILEEVISSRRPAVLVVNKWDLIEKDSYTADAFTLAIKDTLARYAYLPLIYISALSGQRVGKVLSIVKTIHVENHRRIPTSELNIFLQKAVARNHPPARQGKYIKFNYITQSEVAPPTFIIFINQPKLIEKTYISYIANQIRSEYGFQGVSFRLKFKRK